MNQSECGCGTKTVKGNYSCHSADQKGNINKQGPQKTLTIDFLYLDLEVCERCQGTENQMEQALNEVSEVLKTAGYQVEINKIHIDQLKKAVQYEFESSPTIRINGRDIQMEVKESSCGSCSDIADTSINCRTWEYQGKEYSVPPKEMIIESILREVYSDDKHPDDQINVYQVPENIHRFFAQKENRSCGCNEESCC
ncbi:MAG: DUF2703 domain-containing protein [Bacillaceae bacterium]|nr:DUF2703 domain-containing protein [Bacillaceae bacterium]